MLKQFSNKLLRLLNEEPILNGSNIDLYDSFLFLSKEELEENYVYYEKLSPSTAIYVDKENKGFIVGGFSENNTFLAVMFVACKEINLKIKSNKIFLQIEMVEISKHFAKNKISKLVYILICKKFNLVSGSEHFISSKNLWKSLAKENFVNTYIYYKLKHELIDNIEDEKIWGLNNKYKNVLLIASKNKLTTKQIE